MLNCVCFLLTGDLLSGLVSMQGFVCVCVCAYVNAYLCLFLSASLLTGDLLSGLVSLQ